MLRVFLAGGVAVDGGFRLVDEGRFPGRQGRLVFAMLAAEHDRPVSRDELAEELWREGLPSAWEASIRAIVSKLRRVLGDAAPDASRMLKGAFGFYQLRLPPDAWIDIEAAADAIHRAEALLRADRAEEACGWALAARAIARRPFLPGSEGPWATRTRRQLRDVSLRSVEALAEIWIRVGDPGLAAADAEEALRLEPFRESAHRALIRAHVASGNRAEALRAYERCRRLLTDQLGVDPSPQTEAVYLEALGRS